MKNITIGNFNIGQDQKPFIIAEMSGNHNQSLDRAKGIIKAAAESGVQAVKLQTYTADTMTINHRGGLFDITDKDPGSPEYKKIRLVSTLSFLIK